MKKILLAIAILFSLVSFSQIAPIDPGVTKSNDYHYFVWKSPYPLGTDVTFDIISSDGDVVADNHFFQSAYINGVVYNAFIYYIKGGANPKYRNYLIRTNYNGGSSGYVPVEWVVNHGRK